jgi:hypothetical protein
MYKTLRTFRAILTPLQLQAQSRRITHRTIANMANLLKKPVKLGLIQLASGNYPSSSQYTLPSNTISRRRQIQKSKPRPLQSPRSFQSRRQNNRPPRMFQQSLRLRLLPLLRGNSPPITPKRRTITLLPRSIVHGQGNRHISNRWLNT